MNSRAHRRGPPQAILCLFAALLSPGARAAATDGPDATWTTKIDALLAEYDRPDEPGLSVGVVQDGRLAYAKGFGAANLEYNVPNTPETLFEIASFSKAFTSLCVAILLDQGTIEADDDVRKYVPELHAFDPPIRIRHLLTCHSGLWAQVHIMPLAGWENMPIHSPYFEGDLLAILSGQRTLPFEPGTEFRYGSSDFFLLGLVVKRVTGQSLAEFARENVFEPLGMSRTFYLEDGSRVVKNRAVPYHKLPDPRGPWHQWPVNGYVVGGGGVWTSVEDLARFDHAFDKLALPNGKHVREFFENGSVLGNRYCLDADAYRKKADPELAVHNPPGSYRGLKRIQFTGGWFGMASAMGRFPDEHVTIICLSNSSAISPFAKVDEIAEVMLGDKLQPKKSAKRDQEPSPDAPKLTQADFAALEGAFRMHDHGGVWRVFVRDGLLYYTNHLNETFELGHIGGNRFEAVDTPYAGDVFVFRKASDNAAYSLWLESGESEIGFDRVELVHPSADELGAYTGEFYNDELLTTYRFQVRDDALWLRVNNRRWEQLDPTVRDEFVLHVRHPHDIRIFTFERDEAGQVVRLRVDFWRIQGLVFQKQP